DPGGLPAVDRGAAVHQPDPADRGAGDPARPRGARLRRAHRLRLRERSEPEPLRVQEAHPGDGAEPGARRREDPMTTPPELSVVDTREGLVAQGLVRDYGRFRVVNDVTFRVRRGEVVGLLGPNGAGKTTSFYMIVGLLRPNSGSIFFD